MENWPESMRGSPRLPRHSHRDELPGPGAAIPGDAADYQSVLRQRESILVEPDAR